MSPNDNTGLGLFDEAASAAGNFPGALRGYDRQAVDDYVRTLEASVVQARRHAAELEQQVGGLQDRLSQSQAREGNPEDVDYSDLGGRASDILRLAQEQAHDLTNLANVEAERTDPYDLRPQRLEVHLDPVVARHPHRPVGERRQVERRVELAVDDPQHVEVELRRHAGRVVVGRHQTVG